MKKKVVAVDIDETLCTNVTAITKISDYDNAKPNIEIITLINKLYKKNYIVLYTARGKLITKNKPNLKKKLRRITLKQLKNWNVKYHKLNMNKIFFDFIVDDKSINPSIGIKNLINLLDN